MITATTTTTKLIEIKENKENNREFKEKDLVKLGIFSSNFINICRGFNQVN